MRMTFACLLALALAGPLSFTGCDRYEHSETKTTTDPNGNVTQQTKTVTEDANGNVTEKKTDKTVTDRP